MATINIYWRDPNFSAFANVDVPRAEAVKVLEQWDKNAEIIFFRSTREKEHRIRAEEIRRIMIDGT